MPPGPSRLHCCPEGLDWPSASLPLTVLREIRGIAFWWEAMVHHRKLTAQDSIPAPGLFSVISTVDQETRGALGHRAVSTPTTPPDTCVCVLSLFSHVRLFGIPWTEARQAPLSMEFSRQEYWSGLPCPPAGDLPDPGIKPRSPTSPALAGRFLTTSATREANAIRQGTLVCFEP